MALDNVLKRTDNVFKLVLLVSLRHFADSVTYLGDTPVESMVVHHQGCVAHPI
jgi:hypothetical protein